MAFRTFSDSRGREWQAFDVIPRTSERRAAERRAATSQPELEAELEAERREVDRRLTVGGTAVSSATLRGGWLLFERGSDQRRLAPIPENWQRCTDAELDAYLATARPVAPKKERRG